MHSAWQLRAALPGKSQEQRAPAHDGGDVKGGQAARGAPPEQRGEHAEDARALRAQGEAVLREDAQVPVRVHALDVRQAGRVCAHLMHMSGYSSKGCCDACTSSHLTPCCETCIKQYGTGFCFLDKTRPYVCAHPGVRGPAASTSTRMRCP